jgi:hypothetical protein
LSARAMAVATSLHTSLHSACPHGSSYFSSYFSLPSPPHATSGAHLSSHLPPRPSSQVRDGMGLGHLGRL